MIQVLFVCLGNICRSPLAEAVFQHLVEQKSLSDLIQCNSAGTAAYHIGEQPDPRTVAVATKNQIAISHRGQQFAEADFDQYHYIVVMDKSNLRDVLFKGGELGKNVFLMRHFDPLGPDGEVPDPYYGGPSGFDEVFDILERSCAKLLDHLITEHSLK